MNTLLFDSKAVILALLISWEWPERDLVSNNVYLKAFWIILTGLMQPLNVVIFPTNDSFAINETAYLFILVLTLNKEKKFINFN